MTAKFHKMHYVFVAKRIRENFDPSDGYESATSKLIATTNRAVLADLALDFARSFKEDNPSFDPLKFLDACSPDYDLFPLSELWDDE